MAQYFPHGAFVQAPPHPHPHLQMQNLIHAQVNTPKPFSPLVMPQPSLLGAPPGGRGVAMNPFLNAAVFARGPPPRGVPVKPHIPAFNKRPVVAPSPINNGEILSKLAKLIPEFSNAEKSTFNSQIFNDLLKRGLNKQTAPNFYAALETLAVNIGKEEFNQKALWRVFEFAFLNKYLFSSNPSHVENISKWKRDADSLMSVGRKRDLGDNAANNNAGGNAASATNPSAAKRARTVPGLFPHKNYNVVDVGQQVEVLQEELVAAKEELKALRDQHKREIDFLYQHLGIAPPAPPTPEPEPEPEVEAEPEPAQPAEPAQSESAETTENAEHTENTEVDINVENHEEQKVGEVEMAEPAASS